MLTCALLNRETIMTKTEAEAKIQRLNKIPKLHAKLVRVLPAKADPVKAGDNGWDVEVSTT